MIKDVYVEGVISHYGSKYFNFIASPSSTAISPSAVFQTISDNVSASKAPQFLSFFFFKFINNALPTSRRCRHINNTRIYKVAKCFYCGHFEDSFFHMLTACNIINKAR